MADVVVMHRKNDMIPMVTTQAHIAKIQSCISGKVYWCENEQEALAKRYDAEVLFFWGASGRMPERFCGRSRKLKWIQSFSAGVDAVMSSSIRNLPVTLTNVRGIHGRTMALTTLGYMIQFTRCFPEIWRQQQRHVWSREFQHLPGELTHMTVGIVGAGAIGSEVAKICRMLDMKTLGVKRHASPLENFDRVYPAGDLNLVLEQSDFVVVATPLTEETYHMFQREQFKVMKNTSIFINIGRGAVVNEEDLIEALQSEEIGGAALDTVEQEPLCPESPLWDMKNVIITPHCAAVSGLYMDRAVELFCENLKRYEAGMPLMNVIDMSQKG